MTSHPKHEDSTSSLHQKLDIDSKDKTEETKLSADELETKLSQAEEKAHQSWDRLLRLQADMDNLRRRSEKDIENAHKYALEKFISELLPIIDSLERAFQSHHDEDKSSGSLLDGVGLTLKMLYNTLEKFGIQQIDPLDQPFNPEHHQAVSTENVQDKKAGSVLSVLQKGYLLNNRLVRPALVIVSK